MGSAEGVPRRAALQATSKAVWRTKAGAAFWTAVLIHRQVTVRAAGDTPDRVLCRILRRVTARIAGRTPEEEAL
jgi:hypothetical protein